jgi:tetratricopeptide (TPR) repeat protein
MKLKLILAISLILFLNGAGTASLAMSDGKLARSEGLAHLQAGRYQMAEAYLRQAVREQPDEPTNHYYLANTLVFLQNHEEAVAEYKRAYQLDPYGPISGYCRRALKTYKSKVPSDDTVSGVAADAVIAAKPIDATVHQTGIGGAIDKIRKDTEAQKRREKGIVDDLSSAAIKSGEAQASAIQQAARDEIDRILNPVPVVGGRTTNPQMFDVEYQKAQAEEVRRSAEDAAARARSKAEQRAEYYKRLLKDHSDRLDESAVNLQHQLHERNLPGTPRLAETGTGLYVRNYHGAERPSPYPEPHASVARISRTVVGPNTDSNDYGQHAKELSANDEGNNTVRGVVIKHN